MQPVLMNDGLYLIALMRMKDENEAEEARNEHNNDNVKKITSTLHSL